MQPVRPNTDRITADGRRGRRRRRAIRPAPVPTADSVRHALNDLREQTLVVVALFEVALQVAREGDSDRVAELYMLGLDAARGARERARSLDDAFRGERRGGSANVARRA